MDDFADLLLRHGIEVLVDVRHNPVSRKHGFNHRSLHDLACKMGVEYRHLPALGIPGHLRRGLNSNEDYQRLLDWYKINVLPQQADEIRHMATLMRERPTVLMCMEKDADRRHRSRLADAIQRLNNLKVIHL